MRVGFRLRRGDRRAALGATVFAGSEVVAAGGAEVVAESVAGGAVDFEQGDEPGAWEDGRENDEKPIFDLEAADEFSLGGVRGDGYSLSERDAGDGRVFKRGSRGWDLAVGEEMDGLRGGFVIDGDAIAFAIEPEVGNGGAK